jgi:hypothetical protein
MLPRGQKLEGDEQLMQYPHNLKTEHSYKKDVELAV